MNQKEDQLLHNKRKKFLEEIKEELGWLKDHQNDHHTEYVQFLFEKIPPKHREEGEWREWRKLLPGDREFPRGGWKKIMMKLVTVYHPDRVDKEKQSEKYHFLCEEVTKELTQRYTQLKG